MRLADQVRRARAVGLRIEMVHEDGGPEYNGCQFSHFFVTTPHDLIADGLYSALAVTWMAHPSHRTISIKLTAKALGAVEHSDHHLSRTITTAISKSSNVVNVLREAEHCAKDSIITAYERVERAGSTRPCEPPPVACVCSGDSSEASPSHQSPPLRFRSMVSSTFRRVKAPASLKVVGVECSYC